MKIGIITWYTGPNYGTNLQAIALQWFLRNKGYYVELIDYDEKLIAYDYHRSIIERTVNKPKRIVSEILMNRAKRYFGNDINKRDVSLSKTIREKCMFSSKVETEEQLIDCCNSYDCLVIGSDQLWNPNWYAPLYYADYENIHTRTISYAPSLGVNEIPNDKLNRIKHGLSRLKAISVREQNGADLIEKMGVKRPKVVVDPTLLLSCDDWMDVFSTENTNKSDNYVLSVFLDDKLSHWHAAKTFAKRNRLKHVVVPYVGLSYFQKAIVCADADLEKLLILIRGASYIITDSFHITVFSIIHRKQFVTIQRFKENKSRSTNERIRNLLDKTELSSRLLPYGTWKIPKLKNIDYSIVSLNLKREIEESKEYLINALNNL